MLPLSRAAEQRADATGPRNGLVAEQKQPEPGSLGILSEEAIVFVHHVLQILVGSDGDEGVEVLVGELVLDREVGGAGELAQLGEEGGEGGGVAMEGNDAGVAANVAQLVVVRPRQDLAAKAAHEADERRRPVPANVVRSRRGCDRVGGGVDLRREVVRTHRCLKWKVGQTSDDVIERETNLTHWISLAIKFYPFMAN